MCLKPQIWLNLEVLYAKCPYIFGFAFGLCSWFHGFVHFCLYHTVQIIVTL